MKHLLITFVVVSCISVVVEHDSTSGDHEKEIYTMNTRVDEL